MKNKAARAASFANTAELYERARPGYPPDLIEALFAEIGLDRPRILDVGAGTGKLTRQLVPYGSVIAVEPLDEMRAQLERVVPDVDCRPGSAEAIPLPDASVDVVTVGQADDRWVKPVAERAPVLEEVAALVADFPDPFDVDFTTEAYWCRKLPLSAS